MAKSLNQRLIECTQCPRLIKYCRKVAKEKRKSFQDWTYWGRPLPNFGNLPCKLLIVGLAPAAHGANRTGRLFTGDNSGLWLYRAMFRAGFANQAESSSLNDGLQLIDACVTCVAHCAPPDNKPEPQEIAHCAHFFEETLVSANAQVILVLGRIAWDAVVREFKKKDTNFKKPEFGHGAEFKFRDQVVIASYHPSQQNTFTKRLTEEMFDAIFSKVRAYLN